MNTNLVHRMNSEQGGIPTAYGGGLHEGRPIENSTSTSCGSAGTARAAPSWGREPTYNHKTTFACTLPGRKPREIEGGRHRRRRPQALARIACIRRNVAPAPQRHHFLLHPHLPRWSAATLSRNRRHYHSRSSRCSQRRLLRP